MSLVKILPAWFHAIADYGVGILLVVGALITTTAPDKAVATGVVVGVVVLTVSMLTRYPLGVVKVLPFNVHSAGDYLAAVLLIGAPFALDFDGSSGGLSTFYIAAGIAVLAVSLITNYQYSPKRQPAMSRRDRRGVTPPHHLSRTPETPPRGSVRVPGTCALVTQSALRLGLEARAGVVGLLDGHGA